ncbi:hypothetical protein FJ936_09035 [Mesorhizobium sp. B2-4-13]|uniref:peroxidase family protein n=1 Tax=Mesorhizobium sp. B2-4-13 TaxID=2589936 RepID=UPI00114F16A5|nr:peroxidase family protein [Mesorhizobium sp. B2-4-13]TPK85674.1 hypothetical protein FJ936_09035 [Mesorhizobium sp. B2-4-13]
MPSIKPFDITLSDINFLLDQMRDAILITGYDASGQAIYGYTDAGGTTRTLGLFGTFDPLSIIDPITHLSIYDGAREASGFRIPIGFFNNLVDLTRWHWGATNDPFPRLTEADYNNYVAQVLTNPALTNYTGTLSDTTQLASPSAYGDLNSTVIDYTPRMITQTISSSYGAPDPATAVGGAFTQSGVPLTGSSAAQLIMAPGELLIVALSGGDLVPFQFFDSAVSSNPSANGVVGIDVHFGLDFTVSLDTALGAIAAGLAAHGVTDAAASMNSEGRVVISTGSPAAGEMAIFDYAGLGLGGTYAPAAGADASAMIRMGVYTDVVTSENVIGVGGTTETITEYMVRNLNTLPGDPSTSGIFTLFGQFFDHGLDFIGKGGQGSKIIIPLDPSDPMYSQSPSHTITISRATPDGYTVDDLHGRAMSIAGADNVWGTGDDLADKGADGEWGTADDQFLGGADKDLATTAGNFTGTPIAKPETTTYTNHTSPYIDQSQSYGSDSQTTYILREWVEDPNHPGTYIPGAELLDGHQTQAYNSQYFDDSSATGLGVGQTTRTLPTLAELRAHLAETGRDDLTWDDINNLRARDETGHVIDTNGNAAGGFVYTGEALLLDINPDFTLINFSNSTIQAGGFDNFGQMAPFIDFSNFSIRNDVGGTPVTEAQYAAIGEALMESLGNHYIAGDGRANENFGLTAIHHVFHANHNVQLVNLETMVLQSPDVDARHGYQTAVNDGFGGSFTDSDGNYTLMNVTGTATIDQISWNQDKMFEAAKLVNEMEYQHVAIDQYARLVTPDLPEFVTYDNDINSDISLEYSQAAFRFGHSQLRETIDAIDPNGTVTKWALEAAFLNPGAYKATGAEDILRGMSQQLTNEVDEFVTPAMQQTLLGQPLDLAAINIARGRDVGMPTLNQVRAQLHDALVAERLADPATPHHTNLIVDALNPYTSWAEFASQMQHPESLVDFIAAYSFDGDVAKAQEVLDLETGVITGTGALTGLNLAGAIEFLNGGDKGYDKIDFWIGGLAELHVFTGQLGTTFNAIFEDQMERLMDGDRFYYLYRLGLALNIDPDLGHAITTEQFKDIIERATGAQHLNGDVMGWSDHTFELAPMYATALANNAGMANGFKIDPVTHAVTGPSTATGYGIYSGSGNSIAGNGTLLTKINADLGLSNTYIADFRPDVGENPDGTPSSGYNSHETFAGTDYNDWLDAGNGDDTIYGDKGDDVLDGKAGADHIYGGDGQDVIYGGDIEDFLDGGAGDDIIYAGTSAGALDVAIGGHGNDRIYGEAGIDELYGGEGDDYIDAGGDTDLAFGDSGNDIMFGGDGPDELRGGEGDDMLSGGSGSDQLKGEHGDDIFFGGIGQAAQTGDSDENLGDTGFDIAAFSDTSIVLDTAADLRNVNLTGAPGGTAFEPFNQLWTDLEGVIGSKFDDTIIGADNTGTVDAEGVNSGDNWLIGGGGNDTFNTRTPDSNGSVGGSGFDVIIGDKIRLDTLIGAYGGYDHSQKDANGNIIHSYSGTLGDGLLANAALGTEMFAKHFTELLKTEDRKDLVLGSDPGSAGTSDVAIFTGNKADYSIDIISHDFGNADGLVTAYKITDNRDPNATDANGDVIPTDGTDLVVGVEVLRFVDGDIHLPLVAPSLDLHAFNIGNATDDFSPSSSYAGNDGTINWLGPWTEIGDNNGTGGDITIANVGSNNNPDNRLNFNADVANNDSISRAVDLTGVTAATLSFTWNENGADPGENILVFAYNGSSWDQIGTLAATNNNASGNFSFDLTPAQIGAHTAIRFQYSEPPSGVLENNENFYIDNVNIRTSAPINDNSNDYNATFAEGGSSVHIASGPSIADDGSVIYSAKVVLTNAKAGDSLNRNDINGDGITGTTDTSVAGQITVNLTGASTFAAYQAAIQAVTFSNNSQNPDPADRIIHVTVKDELINSNVATTTIHVTPVNDAPNAGNDNIVTNIQGAGSVVIPDWALLANDTDPDGPVLAFDALVGSANSGSASHAAGAVTFTDTGSSSTGNGGNAQGSMGSFTYRVTDNGTPAYTDNATGSIDRSSSGTSGNINGSGSGDIIVGDARSSTIDPGGGNDIVFAGGGNDTIVWNANSFGGTDGHDFVDGGSNTGTGDRFTANGNNSAEVFRIYSVAEAVLAGLTGLNAGTEIVVTRNTNGVGGAVTNGNIIAELKDIEEITVNTSGGTDNVLIVGDFSPSHLQTSTITINGSDGDDTVDISGLTSDHRIVFHGAGGTNHVIGDLRPQDVVDNVAPGNGGDTSQGDDDDDDDNDNEHQNRAPAVNGAIVLPSLGANTAMLITAATLLAGASDADGDSLTVTNLTPSSGTVTQGPDGWTFTPNTDDTSQVSFSYDISDGQASVHQTASLDLTAAAAGEGDGGDAPVPGGDAHLGTDGDDVMIGGPDADVLSGGHGDDVILGNDGADTLLGGAGDDLIKAGAGDDVVFGGAGNDIIFGGDGHDMLFGDAGDDRIFGDAGNDVIEGGAGNDTVYGGSGDDRIIANVGDGNDVYWGEDGQDTLDYAAISASLTIDLGNGLLHHGSVSSAQSGQDTVFGFENVIAGSGNDTIIANDAANTMDGGLGNDTFVFGSAADANGDTIVGLQPGDKIDLSMIDANTSAAGHQSFVLFAGAGFTSAGQVMVNYQTAADGEHTLVKGEVNGDGVADFSIDVAGHHDLDGTSFKFA